MGTPSKCTQKLPTLVGLLFLACLSIQAEETSTEQAVANDFTVKKVRILLGGPGRLRGCLISGSNEGPDQGFTELRRIPFAKQDKNGWFMLEIKGAQAHRWLRVSGFTDKMLPVAELEFLSANGKLTGTSFGYPLAGLEQDWDLAFDGNDETICEATSQGGYVGLDLGPAAQAQLSIEPPSGVYGKAIAITIRHSPADGTVRYTLDGSMPSQEHGLVYDGPIPLKQSAVLTAVACKKGLAASSITSQAYAINGDSANQPPVTSLHLGDDLSDDASQRLTAVCLSAGRNYQSLQAQRGNGNKVEGRLAAGVNHLFLQAMPGTHQADIDNGNRLITLARSGNPQLQPWLTAQWLGADWYDDADWAPQDWQPPVVDPKNWEEAMYNLMAYEHDLLAAWNAAVIESKRVQLCPNGTALIRLKNEIDVGQVPGMNDLFQAVFHDGRRLNAKGSYLMACVAYACMFGESPAGQVSRGGTGLSLEQAQIFERIAWETVIGDADTGHAVADQVWYPVAGSPDPTVPFEFYSPAVMVNVTHSHADDGPTVPYASGMLINRHVWPKRSLQDYKLVTRDSPGRDQAPYGTDLPLAVFPKLDCIPKRDGQSWGGELLDEVAKDDGRSLHQVQWDYLQGHVNRAYNHYIMQHQDIWPDDINDLDFRADYRDQELTPEYLNKARGNLNEYQRFIAIANYASAWQGRTNKGGARSSVHGVDVLHYGHHCGGTSKIFMQMYTVAGFQVRMLGWNCHMSNEVRVGKKWVFADMILRKGAENRSFNSWAELTADPEVYPTAVLSYARTPIAR